MATSTDNFGRTITYDDAGNYTVTGPNGVEISGQHEGGITAIAAIVNSMRPAYAPPPPEPPQTMIAPLDLMNRLTETEQAAIAMAAQSSPQVWLFSLKLVSVAQVDVTDPLTISGTNAMVAAGLLTQDRVTQWLDLSLPSP